MTTGHHAAEATRGESRLTSRFSRFLASAFRLPTLGPVAPAQLVTLGCCEFARSALFLAALPAILQHRLHVPSVMTLGWLSGLLFGSDTLLRSPSGWIVDHLGVARTTLLASGTILLGMLVIGFAPSVPVIAAGVLLVGAGGAPTWTSVIAGVTGGAGQDRQARALSVIFLAWLVGGGLGTVASLFLLDRLLLAATLGMLIAAVGVGVGAAVVAAVILRARLRQAQALSGKPAIQEDVPILHPHPGAGGRTYLRRLGQALYQARPLIPGLFIQTFILALVLSVTQRYATTVLQWTSGQVIYLLLCGGLLVIVLLVPVSKLVDRYSPRVFLRLGFVAAAPPLAVLAFVRYPYEGAAVAAVLGASYAFILISWNALLAKTVPADRRGGMWGVFTTIEGIGAACGPPVAGALWENVHPSAPFLTGAAALIVIAIVYTIYPIDRQIIAA